MSANIAWPLATDAAGNYVSIGDATKAGSDSCPECSAPSIARQGTKKRWHFAHRPGAACTGEGARHSLAKHLIARRLQQPIAFSMRCQHDFQTEVYQLNLSDVAVEEVVVVFRADVAFSIQTGERMHRVSVEVVDRHETGDAKQLALMGRYFEVTFKDLNDEQVFDESVVEERLLKGLGRFLPKLAPRTYGFIHVWQQPCWKCHNQTTVVMHCEELDENGSPPDAVLRAMRQPARVEWRTTSGRLDRYSANVCQGCGATQGEFYLFVNMADSHYADSSSVKTIFWQA